MFIEKKGVKMKLKLGLLLTALVVAQAPVQAGLFSETTKPAQQLDIVSKNVQDYLAAQRVGAQAKAAPAGLTSDQQAAYDKLMGNITTITNAIKTNLIPAVSKAVAGGGFGFMDGITLATSTGPTLFSAATDAVSNIKTLHTTNTSARAVIKNNLATSLNQVGFTDIVNKLVGLVNQLPDGTAKALLSQIVPKLKEVPGLITSLL